MGKKKRPVKKEKGIPGRKWDFVHCCLDPGLLTSTKAQLHVQKNLSFLVTFGMKVFYTVITWRLFI